jgi:[acyl-carrier-protein] S-malonyltransferase
LKQQLRENFMTKRAFIFPGQGSQSVGMGKDVANAFLIAKETFEEVDEALKQNLSKVIFEGSVEELTNTSNTQPALMAVSIAILRVIEQQGQTKLADLCDYVAGHSLGEYTALTAAGSLSLVDAAKLLRIRGNAMQDAVPKGEGGMAALIGIEFDAAKELASSIKGVGVCQAANDNGGGQVVLSGTAAAIDKVIAVAKERGIRRAIKLPVSAPFHSDLMKPAADKMAEALSEINFVMPSVPLIANVIADEVTDPEAIKKLLVEQVTGTVRWRETILGLKDREIESTVEIGSGKVLSGLTGRIEKSIIAVNIQTPEDIEKFLKSL